MTDQIIRNYTDNNKWEFDQIRQDAIHVDMKNKKHLSLSNNDSNFIVKAHENAVVELMYENGKS